MESEKAIFCGKLAVIKCVISVGSGGHVVDISLLNNEYEMDVNLICENDIVALSNMHYEVNETMETKEFDILTDIIFLGGHLHDQIAFDLIFLSKGHKILQSYKEIEISSLTCNLHQILLVGIVSKLLFFRYISDVLSFSCNTYYINISTTFML